MSSRCEGEDPSCNCTRYGIPPWARRQLTSHFFDQNLSPGSKLINWLAPLVKFEKFHFLESENFTIRLSVYCQGTRHNSADSALRSTEIFPQHLNLLLQ